MKTPFPIMIRASDEDRDKGEIEVFRNGAELSRYPTSISNRRGVGALFSDTSWRHGSQARKESRIIGR
ncbi:MAG TPA: hypothetical protein VMM54_10075 [Nitrospirota bacterium]|nr:hypothetical protein [Nitrospirota bacterium]